MERRSQHRPLANEHGAAFVPPQDLYAVTGRLDRWGPDERNLKRLSQSLEGHGGFEGVDLAPVRVTPHHDVHDSQPMRRVFGPRDVARHQDEPRASPKEWHPGADALFDRAQQL